MLENKSNVEKRGCREKNFNFSLRSMEIRWSSSDGQRFKVGVLGEGYTWIPKTPGFARKVREVKSFGFRKCSRNFIGSLLTLQEVGIISNLVYFPFLGVVWLIFNGLRGYLVN